jgi:hypothetical protein
MASKAVMDAVAAELASAWGAIAASIRIIPPNDVAAVPADGSAFLAYEFPLASEDQITIGAPGDNVFRETGAFRIVLCAPIGSGVDPWAGYVDALRAAFRARQFSGVNCWAPSPPAIDNQSDRGAYFEFSFAIPYYFDLAG